MVKNSAPMIGPMMKPRAPKSDRPPSVLRKTSSSGIWVSRPTTRGRRRLSTIPTTSTKNAVSAIAVVHSPPMARKTTAGTQTRPVPSPGITASATMTAPQNAAAWTPATANARPPSVPWARPISPTPLSVARVTDRNRERMRSSSCSASGRYQRMRSSTVPPWIRKKKSA